MGKVCSCGSSTTSPTQELHCSKCGGACCPSCVYARDAAHYCSRCAETIVDANGLPLTVSAPAASIWARPADVQQANGGTVVSPAQWLVLVARDQPDLFTHLLRAFARDDKVEIVIDRRKDYSRNPPGMEDRLRTHGAAVIKRRF